MSIEYRILIIDDNKLLCNSLRARLERRGFSVVIANDVATARRVIQNQTKLEVVILDVRLEDPHHPTLTGLDFTYSITGWRDWRAWR